MIIETENRLFSGYGCSPIHEAIHCAMRHGLAAVTVIDMDLPSTSRFAYTYAGRHGIRIRTHQAADRVLIRLR